MLKTLKNATRFFSSKESKQELLTEETKGSGYSSLFAPISTNTFSFSTNNVKWMQYYSTVAPVGDGVDKIADKASKIPLLLFAPDEKEAEMPIHNHPFLKLLKNPNPDQTREDFVKEFIVHATATGNNYFYLTGGISADKDRIIGAPVEAYNLRPDFINIAPTSYDGRALYYQYTQTSGKILTFNRTEIKDINGKYVEAYIESNGNGQLYNFRNISSRTPTSYYQLFGMAPLQACELQIGQFFEAAVYNYFLIVNGLSARKMISLDSKEIFSQAQKDVLKKFVEENFSGSMNSGKSIVSPIPFKVDDLQIGLKDMDFKSLNEATLKSVYSKLNIPLPLTDSKDTSMNNMSVSELMLYDNAILPALDTFCGNLFTFPFQQRYKDAQEFIKLGYNPTSIAALQPRMAQNLKLYKESGDTTVNERREYMGMSRIPNEACDEIYINNNMVPIGTDTNLTDTIGIDQQADKNKQLEFLLRNQKKPDGSSLYSEQEIKKYLLSS